MSIGYIYDCNGYYKGQDFYQKDPLNPGSYFDNPDLSPIKPLEPKEGYIIRLVGDKCIYEKNRVGETYWHKESRMPITIEEQIDFEIIDDNYTETAPKEFEKWDGKKWKKDIEAYNKNQKDLRGYAYREESDPLFFKFQRGEGTQEDWFKKVEEIKERYKLE